jgi:hypothetical protein
MKRTFTINYGSFEARLMAEEGDDWQDEVLETLSFIKSNEEAFDSLPLATEASDPTVSEISDTNSTHGKADGGTPQTAASFNTYGGPLEPVAKELKISEKQLEEVIYTDIEGGDNPLLLTEDTSLLGDKQTDQQRNASLILLYVWEKCYGEDRVLSSDLKEALSLSGVKESNMGNMYQGAGDRYFSRKGRGASASVALTPPGRRTAQRELKDLFEKVATKDD